MYKVLFVCTANICRTPIAEYYLNHLVKKEGLEELIMVESAGTWAIEGMPAAEFSRQVCAGEGLDLSNHRSQPIDLYLMKQADLVLCMSSEHKNDLSQIFPHLKDKIFTLKEYNSKNTRHSISIPDPYGMPLEQYQETYKLITGEIDRIFASIKQNARENAW